MAVSPKMVNGMVMQDTTINNNRQGGRGPVDKEDSSPAWIQLPAMFPRLPKPQKMATLVPSSDCLYQEP